MHCVFVDDMMHALTCDKLSDEFLELYKKGFDYTGGGLMETFLGMEVEQPGKVIKLHLGMFRKSWLSTRLISRKHFARSVFR